MKFLQRFTLCFILLLTPHSWSASPSGGAEGTYCVQCEARSLQSKSELNGFISDIQDRLNMDHCENFTKDDRLGPWGKLIISELDSGKYPELMNGADDLNLICRRYPQMSQSEKDHLWVLIINSMAFYESSCDATQRTRGAPDGTATGLLQLNAGQEHRYAPGCRRGDAIHPERNLICGMSMLEIQLEKSQTLFSNESYWAVLRKNMHTRTGRSRMRPVDHIIEAVRSYLPCNTPTNTN